MGDHLMLRLDDGSTVLILSVDTDGRLHYEIQGESPEAPPYAGRVADDLALARLVVWARDTLRSYR